MGRFPYYIILLIMAFQANAQYMHYSVKDGDTINIVDKDSLRQGVWRTYYSTGKFKAEVVYKNSKKQGIEIQWHNNLSNCVKQEAFYNNGVLDGPITYYSKNCKKELIETYKNGVKEGYEISYHNNGQIEAEGNYKKGNLDGVYKIYDKAGKFSFESRSTNEEVTFEPNMEDTANYGVYKVLARNTKWKKTMIVTDLTGSMYPYAKEINTWLRLHFMKDTAQQYFVFFNDGDNKKDAAKKIGITGGIYVCRAKTTEDLVNTMKLTIKKGEGGDTPENVVEAILTGLKKVRKPDNIILIADNWAKARDLVLLSRVKVPVRVILCGVYEGMEINTDYLNIAYKTRGSIHTIEQDITDLINQTSGKKFNINGFDYIIKNGKVMAN
ncbi:MAG: toxin-antitoxin system YwqK family antitoxin [Sphingobacteriaceae bacterium]|nr:toxin-antitoxin system YwqK family antitoxin [Sphingobacteriaceae bacterium]